MRCAHHDESLISRRGVRKEPFNVIVIRAAAANNTRASTPALSPKRLIRKQELLGFAFSSINPPLAPLWRMEQLKQRGHRGLVWMNRKTIYIQIRSLESFVSPHMCTQYECLSNWRECRGSCCVNMYLSICVCSGLWAWVVSRCLISVVFIWKWDGSGSGLSGKTKRRAFKTKNWIFQSDFVVFHFYFLYCSGFTFICTDLYSVVPAHHDQWWSHTTVCYLSKTEQF